MAGGQSRWESGRCRVEDGIFFPDDTMILLSGDPETGYAASPRQSLAPLLQADPEGWIEFDCLPQPAPADAPLQLFAGGGDLEGEGVLVAVDAGSGQLRWVLHLSNSERFLRACVDGDVVVAHSGEYPHRYEWTLPLRDPKALRVVARRL